MNEEKTGIGAAVKNNVFSNVNNLRMYTMILVLIIAMIFFQIVVPGGIFLGARNLSNLFRQLSITGVITMGMMKLIISGNFDLAIGSIVALVGGFAAIMQVEYGIPTIIVIPVALAIGVGLGSWQGFWVAYRKVPSFIVTLGNMMLFRGLYLTIRGGATIQPMHKDFAAIMTTYIPQAAGIVLGIVAAVVFALLTLSRRNSQKKYGLLVEKNGTTIAKLALGFVLIALFVSQMNAYSGIPVSVIILIAVVLLFLFITTKTRYARRVYAIGGNQEAAKLAGIDVKRHVFSLYIITGLLSALSAILLTSRLNAAVIAAGTAYEMDVISACVVGGTSLSGGKGTVVGVVIGALLISVLGNGMSLLNIDINIQNIVKGLVLILAVWFDVATQSKSK
jgi:D-xylose transport system permease protein